LPVANEKRHWSVIPRAAYSGNVPNRAIASAARVGATLDFDTNQPIIGMHAVRIDENVQHERICARSWFGVNSQGRIAACDDESKYAGYERFGQNDAGRLEMRGCDLTTWHSVANAPDGIQNALMMVGAFVNCNGLLGSSARDIDATACTRLLAQSNS
jgi:hypothetical protein